MTLQSNALGLYVPKQRLVDIDAAYAHPREAEKWIADLPTAHIGETSRLIYKALAEINRVSMPVAQRFKLMELFQEPVAYLHRALGKLYLGQPFPLSRKHQKIAELNRELHWEMAIGYKIIIDANLSGFSQRVDNKVFVASINRAMNFLGQTLLISYEVYTAPPENCWLELHHLYLFAEHNNIDQTAIKDRLDRKKTSTILELYKKALLLTVANPYRLPQKEIRNVFAALENWLGDISILPLSTLSNPNGLFVINLDVDEPPSYLHHKKHDLGESQLRIIDTTSLTRVIRERVNEDSDKHRKTAGQRYFGLLPETIKRLVLAWGAIPKRNFSRTGKNIPVNITLGLSATHYFIDKTQADDEHIHYTQKAHFDEHSTADEPPSQPVSQPDVWDIAENPSLQIPDQFEVPTFLDEAYKTEIQEFDENDRDLYESHRCILVNESAGGYCVRWRTNMPLKTMVGSLIGIKHVEGEDKSWVIGVIRWMKTRDEDIFLGIEILAPRAEAIAARNVSHKARVSDYTRCLLLPEARAINLPRTLVTPALYRVGEKLRLDVHGQKVKVKLTKMLENTSTFSQFQFNILQTIEKVTPTDKLDRIKNFDSIWSSIG